MQKAKLIFIMFSLLAVFFGALYFSILQKPNLTKPADSLSEQLFGWKFPSKEFAASGTLKKPDAYSSLKTRTGVPQGFPVRLSIPIINVDTAIEDALITPNGRMDVPEGSVNVAWFSLGPHPGNIGSSVIGGHYGIKDGIPFVFYKLDKLKVGDEIYVTDDRNKILKFVVRTMIRFDRNADATSVFTSNDGVAHLNLITCDGEWNQVNDSYPDRLVVFSDLVPEEKIISIPSISETLNTPIPSPEAKPLFDLYKKIISIFSSFKL